MRKLLPLRNRQRLTALFQRWTHWEFWPAWMFYAPVIVNYIFLAIRYRSLSLPTAANPGIFSGGIVGESKMATLEDIQKTSPNFVARAHLVRGIEDLPTVTPYILKPDLGQRGVGVKLIKTVGQAVQYQTRSQVSLICQAYVPGPHEAGVFYYRHPNEKKGRIFAITEKVFPYVTGDGEKTVEELIWDDTRARCMAQTYLSRLGNRRDYRPAQGEKIRLVEAGNHAQGCIFRDGMWLWTPELEQSIDEISQHLNGFYIGRYDIRYSSEEEFKAGKNFKIIELNGAASEATSIYDSRNSLFSAYRTLFKQWGLVFAIGAANVRNGAKTTKISDLWRTWRQTTKLIESYPVAD